MKLFVLLSPTWGIAGFLKVKLDRTQVIKTFNSIYLWCSIVSVVGIFIYQEYWAENSNYSLNSALPFYVIFLWSYFLLSRCNEVFWAFLKDSFDKMDETHSPASELSSRDRIILSLKSYLELIFNFSILYSLLPGDGQIWAKTVPTKIFDFIYFSGVTITTLGYGDTIPAHWYPKLLTIYEVFCGFILLIVCFTIYTGKIRPIVSADG